VVAGHFFYLGDVDTIVFVRCKNSVRRSKWRRMRSEFFAVGDIPLMIGSPQALLPIYYAAADAGKILANAAKSFGNSKHRPLNDL
jgi:hypothetical protein